VSLKTQSPYFATAQQRWIWKTSASFQSEVPQPEDRVPKTSGEAATSGRPVGQRRATFIAANRIVPEQIIMLSDMKFMRQAVKSSCAAGGAHWGATRFRGWETHYKIRNGIDLRQIGDGAAHSNHR
jgi:hypothetical protein